MDSSLRKPFQGVMNIIRFNWHYYVISVFAVLLVLYISGNFFSSGPALDIIAFIITALTIVSLAVSTYIYDFSGLYQFPWLDDLIHNEEGRIINIHAGYDETSQLLNNRFDKAEFIVLDFL